MLLLAQGVAVACASSALTTARAPRPIGAVTPAGRAWAERTLASLSLREKVAQMVMPWVGGDYVATDSEAFDSLAAWIERDGIGGLVISVGLPHSYAAKLNALQRRARVPLLVASDMENGPGMRMAGIYSFPHLLPQGGGTSFPPAMAVGAAGSDTLAYELGRVLAREARAVGVHVTFGPVLDVNSNPANPIINTRSFGEDPALVARLAAAYIRGAREGGLLTTGKHFPGHGDTETDSHIDLPAFRGDRARLDTVELVPFRRAVSTGVDGMMTAHIAAPGIEGGDAPPATLSRYFMTRVLREELGFGGVLFTDAMNMGAVVKRYGDADALVRAIAAGADVLLMPLDVRSAIEAVLAAVRSGRLAEARIDASVRRILHAKAIAGLDRARLVDLENVDDHVGIRSHAELARTIAQRSITLARDEHRLVPLAPAWRTLLSITYAGPNDPIAGRDFDAVLRADGRAVASVRVDARTSPGEPQELRARADTADAIIVSVYVSPVEYAGTVALEGPFPSLVERVLEPGKPVVLVAFGSPYILAATPTAPAYLLAWGGDAVSQVAAARALLGTVPIGGRLPVSLPPFYLRGEGLARPDSGAAAGR